MTDILLSYEDSKKLTFLYEEVEIARADKDSSYINFLRKEYDTLQAKYDYVRHDGDMWKFDPKFVDDYIGREGNFRVANIMYRSGNEEQKVFIKMKWGKELIIAEENRPHHG